MEGETGFPGAVTEATGSDKCDPLPASRLEGQGWPGMSLARDLAGPEQGEVEPKFCLSPICSDWGMEVHNP